MSLPWWENEDFSTWTAGGGTYEKGRDWEVRITDFRGNVIHTIDVLGYTRSESLFIVSAIRQDKAVSERGHFAALFPKG